MNISSNFQEIKIEATGARYYITWSVRVSNQTSPHLLPTHSHSFPASILFYLLSIYLYHFLLFLTIPISIPLYRYTNTNIFPYSHIHLYPYIPIPISLFIFHFSNFPSLFPPYLPCISCIIKLYKICITEYFSFEYKHTTSHKNRLKRRLGAESGYISIYGQYEHICIWYMDKCKNTMIIIYKNKTINHDFFV